MYTFIQVQCHPKIPDLKQWCLLVTNKDSDLFLQLHKSVASQLFFKYGIDPHFTNKDGTPKRKEEYFYNPFILGSRWLIAGEQQLLTTGYLLVNKAGGFFPPPKNLNELPTIQSEELEWPGEKLNSYEKIVIRKWKDGTHYYLSSSNNRIFAKEKFDSIEDAKREAIKYVSEDRIEQKEDQPIPVNAFLLPDP